MIAKIATRNNSDIKAIAKERGELSKDNRILEYRGRSAVINISGPVFRYANLFTEISGATSTEGIAKAIGEAELSDAENIIFNFDTPGGEATEIANLAEMIRTSPKPTVAYVGAMAASAGYWMASAADRVVIGSTGLVGSIGTVATIDISEDDGETIEIVSSQSPEKRLDPKSEEGQASIQSMVDKMAQVFVEDVAQYRGVSVEHVLTYFGKGGLLMGRDAVASGMADEIGNFESLLINNEGLSMSENKTQIVIAEENFTADFLEEKHNGLYTAILEKGMKLGANAERERIKGVKDQSIAGYDEQVESMMFDGKTTPEQAAVALVKAMKEQGHSIMQSIASTQAPITDEPEDARDDIQKAWDTNADDCRKKFSNFENFKAYTEGAKKGNIFIVGGK